MQGIDDDISTTAARNYPGLHRMFGAYFHQDWHEDYATSTGAVQAFLREAPYATVNETRRELDHLLASPFSDEELGRLLRDGFDCNYVPQADELSNHGWLERIRELMLPVRPA